MVEVKCINCGKSFNVKQYRFDRGNVKYCSSDCHYNYRKKHNLHYGGVGEESHLWKGGKKLTSEGYIEVYCIHHPRALKQSGQSAYVKEHVLIAEKCLGRFLSDEECVHHIDFNRTNNEPDNLYVFSTMGEHTAYHHSLNRGNALPLVSNLGGFKDE